MLIFFNILMTVFLLPLFYLNFFIGLFFYLFVGLLIQIVAGPPLQILLVLLWYPAMWSERLTDWINQWPK